MKLSAQSHASIVSSLQEAIDKFIADGEKTVVTDIHLQPKQDSGELVLFNDDDEELSRTIIEEWVDCHRRTDSERRAQLLAGIRKVG